MDAAGGYLLDRSDQLRSFLGNVQVVAQPEVRIICLCRLGYSLKHKMSQIELLMGDMLRLYVGDPPKNSDFHLNIWPEAQHICVLGRIAGKNA